jgi:hypothetical protein
MVPRRTCSTLLVVQSWGCQILGKSLTTRPPLQTKESREDIRRCNLRRIPGTTASTHLTIYQHPPTSTSTVHHRHHRTMYPHTLRITTRFNVNFSATVITQPRRGSGNKRTLSEPVISHPRLFQKEPATDDDNGQR